MTIQIVTARLRLRPLVLEDTTALLPLFNDWAVIEWLSAPPWPYTEADMRSYFGALLNSSAPDRESYFVIERNNLAIGGIGWTLEPASRQQRGPGPNIGYWLGAPFWGNGYATEALGAAAQHLFTTTVANALYSGVFDGNPASLRVQEKVGFTRDGITPLRSNPKKLDLPHVHTVLTRTRFSTRLETLKRHPNAIS